MKAKVRDLFLLLPFLLTGGALVAYGAVMVVFSVYRTYALLAFARGRGRALGPRPDRGRRGSPV